MTRIQMGQLLFGVSLLVASALSAKSPRFEALREGAAALGPLVRAQATRVEVLPDAGLPVPRAEALQRELAQALAMEGVVLSATTEGRDGAALVVQVGAGAGPDRYALRVVSRVEDIVAPQLSLDLTRTWPSTTGAWALCALMAAAGLVLWRSALRAETRSRGLDEVAGGEGPLDRLRAALSPARALTERAGGLQRAEMLTEVEALLEQHLVPLAQVRQRLLDRMGMKRGSEVLVTLAYAERMLNRAWSAAADGHLPEARSCIPDAHAALEEAARLAGVERA